MRTDLCAPPYKKTCVLVDVNQPLPWVFTRWPRADSLPVSRALGRTSRFCNALLQDLAPLHIKTTRSTNLLNVCRRKLKLSTYLQTVKNNHISFLNTRSQLVSSFWRGGGELWLSETEVQGKFKMGGGGEGLTWNALKCAT